MADPIEVAKLFFTPSGIFLAALGASRTEPLKTGVSLLGLSVAALWIYGGTGLTIPPTAVEQSLACLPWIFALMWAVSLCVHGTLWMKSLFVERAGVHFHQ